MCVKPWQIFFTRLVLANYSRTIQKKKTHKEKNNNKIPTHSFTLNSVITSDKIADEMHRNEWPEAKKLSFFFFFFYFLNCHAAFRRRKARQIRWMCGCSKGCGVHETSVSAPTFPWLPFPLGDKERRRGGVELPLPVCLPTPGCQRRLLHRCLLACVRMRACSS